MKNLTLTVFLLAVAFSGCKDDTPTADFTYSLAGAFSPCNVLFTPVAAAESYQWTINNNTVVSTEKNPILAFDSPGTYLVTLSVQDNGEANQSTREVVIPAPASQMKINSVTLTSYPMTTEGKEWDVYPVASGPDISFGICEPLPNKKVLYVHNTAFEDVKLVQDLKFDLPDDAHFPLQQEGYRLMILDNDNAGYSAIMGYLTFNPWETILATKTYRSSFTVSQNGLTAVLDISWLKE
jgi:hypothetical protein